MKLVRVADIMSTALVAVKDTDTIGLAKVEMDVAAIRHLPVVNEAGRLVGIVSIRDVLSALARAPGQPVHVGDIMHRKVRSIGPNEPAHQAARKMLDARIGSMPVVDAEHILVGMLTETDFVEIAERVLRGAGKPRGSRTAKKKTATKKPRAGS